MMRRAVCLVPVLCLALLGAAHADPPDPSSCVTLECRFHGGDESAPKWGEYTITNNCLGVEWWGTLEESKTCKPSDPCAEVTTTDSNWSIGPSVETTETKIFCLDEDCCAWTNEAPGGFYTMPMDFSVTLSIEGFTYQGNNYEPTEPYELSCTMTGGRANTNKCKKKPDE